MVIHLSLSLGAANGHLALDAAIKDACDQTASLAGVSNPPELPSTASRQDALIEAVWMMPAGAGIKLRSKAWLDFQNDVKVV